MKVAALFTLAVVLGYHMANACPPASQLEEEVQRCLMEMMKFVQADDSDRHAKCPNLKEGVDCVDDILEACKDNAALQGQYSMLKERLAQSRKDFEGFCGPNNKCPPSAQLANRVQKCLTEMMVFVEADASERHSKCPNLKKGVDCADSVIEDCKDSPGLKEQYNMLKERFDDSRKEFERFCGSAVATSSSIFLILSACLLSLWFRK